MADGSNEGEYAFTHVENAFLQQKKKIQKNAVMSGHYDPKSAGIQINPQHDVRSWEEKGRECNGNDRKSLNFRHSCLTNNTSNTLADVYSTCRNAIVMFNKTNIDSSQSAGQYSKLNFW